MNEIILKSFISNLSFISEKIKHPYINNYEINLLNHKPENNDIRGVINLIYKSGETEVVFFEIKIIKTPEILMFKSKYQNEGRIEEKTDTYAISSNQQSFLGNKTKLLVHVVDSKIIDAYCVGKKYKFENGINDNLSKLNMNNKDVQNVLNQTYPGAKKR